MRGVGVRQPAAVPFADGEGGPHAQLALGRGAALRGQSWPSSGSSSSSGWPEGSGPTLQLAARARGHAVDSTAARSSDDGRGSGGCRGCRLTVACHEPSRCGHGPQRLAAGNRSRARTPPRAPGRRGVRPSASAARAGGARGQLVAAAAGGARRGDVRAGRADGRAPPRAARRDRPPARARRRPGAVVRAGGALERLHAGAGDGDRRSVPAGRGPLAQALRTCCSALAAARLGADDARASGRRRIACASCCGGSRRAGALWPPTGSASRSRSGRRRSRRWPLSRRPRRCGRARLGAGGDGDPAPGRNVAVAHRRAVRIRGRRAARARGHRARTGAGHDEPDRRADRAPPLERRRGRRAVGEEPEIRVEAGDLERPPAGPRGQMTARRRRPSSSVRWARTMAFSPVESMNSTFVRSIHRSAAPASIARATASSTTSMVARSMSPRGEMTKRWLAAAPAHRSRA